MPVSSAGDSWALGPPDKSDTPALGMSGPVWDGAELRKGGPLRALLLRMGMERGIHDHNPERARGWGSRAQEWGVGKVPGRDGDRLG